MTKTKPLFKPNGNLMSQLSSLTTKKATKQWYKEYRAFHKGVDQGISYLIGYFGDKQRKFLKKEFGL